MAIPIYPPKYHGSSLTYQFDMAPSLSPGDTVNANSITVSAAAGVTVEAFAMLGNTIVAAKISGGVPGTEYMIEFGATSAYGDVLQEFAILPVVSPI